MRLTLACIAALFSAAAAGPTGPNVRGVVSDQSSGVLPGVTVVARAADEQILATTVTDAAGRYVIGPLIAERGTLTFQLDGFAPVTVPFTLAAGAEVVISQRLALAPRSETVEVYGRMPVPRPPLPPPVRMPPRPRPVTAVVPEHDTDSVCGPAKLGTPESFGTIKSHRAAANGLYARGDELVVDGGTASGLQVGHNYSVRRTFRIEWDPRTETGEHTAALVQIVSADPQSAVAVVIYACGEVMPGDRLASFNPEPLRAPEAAGRPDYKHAARILFPDVGQMLGAPRRMMVIDAGAKAGVRVGQRVTLFRRDRSAGDRSVVGDAVVVAVRNDSATIRVDRVTDPIFEGDWAAIRR